MAVANTSPIFSKIGSLSTNNGTGMPQPITSAANDYTGISANYQLIWTADPTNGGFVPRIRFKAYGTNVASVMRVFVNNGSAATTAANNTLVGEISLPATTAIATAATSDIDYQMGFAIDPSFRIYIGLGTAVAGGWIGIVLGGGKY